MDALIAARAYGAAIKQQAAAINDDGAQSAQGPDFGKMLQGALEQTYKSTQGAESMMAGQQAGRVELIDAVTAVASAETQLQSVIAIRDQVISAYQEIMRMPI